MLAQIVEKGILCRTIECQIKTPRILNNFVDFDMRHVTTNRETILKIHYGSEKKWGKIDKI